MIGVIAVGHEIIRCKLINQSLYECAGGLVFDFIEKYETRNTKLSKVKFRFSYQRVGKLKSRRTFYKLNKTDKGIVIHTGGKEDNLVYEGFICSNCPADNIIYIGPQTIRGIDNIQLPTELVFHMSLTPSKRLNLFIDNYKDYQLLKDIPFTTTTNKDKFRYCEYALVTTEEAYIRALAYNCYPLVWSCINNQNRVGFDRDTKYVNYSDLTIRIVSKNDVSSKLSLPSFVRLDRITRLKDKLKEVIRSYSDIKCEVENKLISFLLKK